MTYRDGNRVPRVTGVAATAAPAAAPEAAAAGDTPASTSQPGSERGSHVKKEAADVKRGRKPSGNSVPPNPGNDGSTASANGTTRGTEVAAPAPAAARPTPMSLLKEAAAEEEEAEAGPLYCR